MLSPLVDCLEGLFTTVIADLAARWPWRRGIKQREAGLSEERSHSVLWQAVLEEQHVTETAVQLSRARGQLLACSILNTAAGTL
jgi:hypothetical protein